MRPHIVQRQEAMILEKVSVYPIRVGDRNDVDPVLQFGPLGDEVEEEAETLRGAIEGRREGFRRGLEELLADGRTHVEWLVIRLSWRGGEGEGRSILCSRCGGSCLCGWLLGHYRWAGGSPGT